MSLHSTIEATRKLVMATAITIGGIIFFIITLNITIAIYHHYHPIPKPKPDLVFGNLPDINFPQTAVDTTNFQYILNTTSGDLPQFPDRETVYQLAPPTANLLALDTISSQVAKLGYLDQPQQVTDQLYKWSMKTPPYKNITFNTYTMDFDLNSSYLTDPDVLAAANLQDTGTALGVAKDLLTTLQSYPNDIDDSKTLTSIFAISGPALNPALSLSQAQIVRIDYFQSDVNKIPVYYPHPPYSTMSVFVASSHEGLQAVEAHYYHKSMTKKSGTYYIKTAKQAYTQLQKGQAYIAAFNGNTQTITIKDVSIGYYVSDQPQSYLTPIIVFTGDNGFYAYVNAITDESISK